MCEHGSRWKIVLKIKRVVWGSCRFWRWWIRRLKGRGKAIKLWVMGFWMRSGIKWFWSSLLNRWRFRWRKNTYFGNKYIFVGGEDNEYELQLTIVHVNFHLSFIFRIKIFGKNHCFLWSYAYWSRDLWMNQLKSSSLKGPFAYATFFWLGRDGKINLMKC